MLWYCCTAIGTAAVVERVENPAAAPCFVIPSECVFNNVLPPQRHRSLRLPVCVRFGFLGRQETWHTHAHTQKRGKNVAVTKGTAWCGTAVVLWLSQCSKLDTWEDSVVHTAAEQTKIQKCGVCIVPGGSGSEETYSVVTCSVFATLNAQSTRHGPRPGSKREPCGGSRVPRSREHEKRTAAGREINDPSRKKVNFIPIHVPGDMCHATPLRYARKKLWRVCPDASISSSSNTHCKTLSGVTQRAGSSRKTAKAHTTKKTL